jgi:uncharacterized protein YutE (UPF0331/DUF86 family)
MIISGGMVADENKYNQDKAEGNRGKNKWYIKPNNISRGVCMEMERMKRYKDKINIILKRLNQIKDWISGYTTNDFVGDEKTKLATYKAFQESVEACMDIVAMGCKDLKIVPKDDYTNIESLDFINATLKAALTEANSLRNRLVHRYNQMDDILVFDGIKDMSLRIIEFVEVLEQWIQQKLKEV